MAVAERPAPEPAGAGLADERAARSVPRRVWLQTDAAVGRDERRRSATASDRPGRRPGPRRAVRGRPPRLPARVPGLPGGPRAVLGRLVHLWTVRRRRVHRAVRLLAGPLAGPPRLATRRPVAVRAPAGAAHPPGLLGGARLQPGGGVARGRSAPGGRARREVGPRQRPARAERLRRAEPQPSVLVDGRRGAAVRRAPAAAAH